MTSGGAFCTLWIASAPVRASSHTCHAVCCTAPTSAVVRQGADLAPDRYSYLSGMGFAVLVGGAMVAANALVLLASRRLRLL